MKLLDCCMHDVMLLACYCSGTPPALHVDKPEPISIPTCIPPTPIPVPRAVLQVHSGVRHYCG